MTELERRDTPAWWGVAAPVPAGGTVGSTDASHAGDLTLNPEYDAINGAATVWADTATAAAAKAIRGTVTVTLLGQSVEYAFGPDTVGTAVADHKAFLAVASGSGVSLGFEDMAGRPGCDYDYNDRTWGGVTVTGADDPVVTFDGPDSWLWHDPSYEEMPFADETATVALRVTRPDPESFRWRYTLTNHELSVRFASPGICVFAIAPDDTSRVTKITTSLAGWAMDSSGGSLEWRQPAPGSGPYVAVGGVATFGFDTPVVPIAAAHGGVNVQGVGPSGEPPEPGGEETGGETGYGSISNGACGPAKGPGRLNGIADITIDGEIAVGATNPEVPGSRGVVTEFSPKNDTNEDTIGGLVVMNSNSNNAPRQQITIQKLKDAAGNPVVGGRVTLTVPGQVKLFDAATQGNSVATGTVFDQTALPKTMWVEGVAYSGAMKDVKIKATPVGNAAGADDVTFTVLWVDVEVATDGKFSANNDKRQDKENITYDAVGKKTDALGINATVFPNGTTIGWSLEGRGLVHPCDFSYPGSDLRLRRVSDAIAHLISPAGAVAVVKTGGFVGDTSLPEWRDDNPLDSCGCIYDIDCPGFGGAFVSRNHPQGTVARYRANFEQIAELTINGNSTRASGTYCYYVCFSLVQTAAAGVPSRWGVLTPADIAGDNTAFGPGRTKLSADLS